MKINKEYGQIIAASLTLLFCFQNSIPVSYSNMGVEESNCLHIASNLKKKLLILTNNFNYHKASFRLFPKGEMLHNSLTEKKNASE